MPPATIPHPREALWNLLWDLGAARRLASAYLLHGDLRTSVSNEVQQYKRAVSLAGRGTLYDLELPDPSISSIIGFYEEIENNSFRFEELQAVQEQRDQTSAAYQVVD